MKTKITTTLVSLVVSLLAPLGILVPQASAAAGICTWTGAAVDDNFSNASNWTGCDVAGIPEDGDSLVFGVASATPNNNMGTIVVASITFNEATTITGNEIGLQSVIVNSSSQIQTNVVIAGGATISGSGYLTIGLDGNNILNFLSSAASLSTGNARITSAITGAGTITSGGNLTLSGENSAFTGPIVVSSGYLTTRSATALGSATTGTTVAAGAFLYFCSITADVTIAEPLTITGTLGDSTIYASPGSCASNFSLPSTNTKLTLSGAVTLTSDVQFYPYGTNLIIAGTYTPNGHTFSVVGGAAGTLTLPSGVVESAPLVTTYSTNSPSTSISAGYNTTAIVTGTYGNVYLSENGVLKGTGTVGEITMVNGKVAPGLSPGCLASGNLNYVGGTLEIEINGATVCTGYDQQTVTGTVALNTATTLNVTKLTTYAPALNSTYIIISNDSTDAVTGTFTGLAQGATFAVNGVTFQISYTGGDGNDVVLTATAVPATVTTPDTGIGSIISSPIMSLISALLVAGVLVGVRRLNNNKSN